MDRTQSMNPERPSSLSGWNNVAPQQRRQSMTNNDDNVNFDSLLDASSASSDTNINNEAFQRLMFLNSLGQQQGNADTINVGGNNGGGFPGMASFFNNAGCAELNKSGNTGNMAFANGSASSLSVETNNVVPNSFGGATGGDIFANNGQGGGVNLSIGNGLVKQGMFGGNLNEGNLGLDLPDINNGGMGVGLGAGVGGAPAGVNVGASVGAGAGGGGSGGTWPSASFHGGATAAGNFNGNVDDIANFKLSLMNSGGGQTATVVAPPSDFQGSIDLNTLVGNGNAIGNIQGHSNLNFDHVGTITNTSVQNAHGASAGTNNMPSLSGLAALYSSEVDFNPIDWRTDQYKPKSNSGGSRGQNAKDKKESEPSEEQNDEAASDPQPSNKNGRGVPFPFDDNGFHGKGSFPLNLCLMLESADSMGFSNVVSWSPDGKSFMIHDTEDFLLSVLPKFFKTSKHTKIRSFYRKLNRWGFTTVRSGSSKGAWHHPDFHRERAAKSLQCAMETGNTEGFELNVSHVVTSSSGTNLAEKGPAKKRRSSSLCGSTNTAPTALSSSENLRRESDFSIATNSLRNSEFSTGGDELSGLRSSFNTNDNAPLVITQLDQMRQNNMSNVFQNMFMHGNSNLSAPMSTSLPTANLENSIRTNKATSILPRTANSLNSLRSRSMVINSEPQFNSVNNRNGQYTKFKPRASWSEGIEQAPRQNTLMNMLNNPLHQIIDNEIPEEPVTSEKRELGPMSKEDIELADFFGRFAEELK